MIYKELIMIKNGIYWQYVMDIGKTIKLNLLTLEDVINFINNEFTNLHFEIEYTDTEFYIITENKLPCKNCP